MTAPVPLSYARAQANMHRTLEAMLVRGDEMTPEREAAIVGQFKADAGPEGVDYAARKTLEDIFQAIFDADVRDGYLDYDPATDKYTKTARWAERPEDATDKAIEAWRNGGAS